MEGEISVAPTPDDYLAANRDWFLASIQKGRFWKTLAGLFSFGFLLGGLIALPNHILEVVVSGALFGLVALSIPLLFTTASWLTLPRRTRRLFDQQKSFAQPWHYRWSEDALEMDNVHVRVRMPWTDFYRWTDGRSALLFFPSELTFYFIPLHVLTAAQADDLRATASRHVARKL